MARGGALASPLIYKGDKIMTNCKLCDRFIISNSVTYDTGVLTINIPAGSYLDGNNYCIVLAQTIPDTAIIGAPVVITIGDSTTTYNLVNRCCKPVTACGIRTRTKYATRVETTATGGVFKMLGKPCCSPDNNLPALEG